MENGTRRRPRHRAQSPLGPQALCLGSARGHRTPLKTSSQSLHAKVSIPARLERVAPGDDFYDHVNGTWLRQTHLPAYRATFSVSDEVERVIEEKLYTIARECSQLALGGREQTTDLGRTKDVVGRLVLSSMRPEKQRTNVEFAKRSLQSMACLRDTTDVAKALGGMMRFGIPTLLSITVEPQFTARARRGSKGRTSTELSYTVCLESGSLGLPDPRYYLFTDIGGEHAVQLLRRYSDLLTFVSKEFDLPQDLSNGISVETEFAKPLFEWSEKEEPVNWTLEQLERKCPTIPWRPLLDAAGLREEHLRRPLHIHSPEWLQMLDERFAKVPLEHWYLLLSIHTALHALPYLPPPFDTRQFELFGRQLYGMTEKVPQHVLTMNILKDTLGDCMSYLYTERHLTMNEKHGAEQLVENIVSTATARLRKTAWLTPSTRARAIEKVGAMSRCVYYSEPVSAPQDLPVLQTDTLLANIYLCNAARMDRRIRRLQTQPVLQRTWDEPAFTANAYYYTDLNQLIVPAGSFVWPFYNTGRLGWTYGGIGAIVAHELIHAFDEEGSELDANGQERPIWSSQDRAKYQQKIDAIVRLYSQAKLDGIFVNGALTASENFADLGGLAIALDALRREIDRSRRSVEARRAELRDFFVSYAVSWRTKDRPKKELHGLFTDRHAPPVFRVNLVVSQFAEWYEAFDVRTDHALYIPPEERIQIF